jgi:hypothetical protein
LAPDGVACSVVVEVADTGDFVLGFLGYRIVEGDVAVLRSARLTVSLEFLKTLVVELLFVSVVLLRARLLLAGSTSRAISPWSCC